MLFNDINVHRHMPCDISFRASVMYSIILNGIETLKFIAMLLPLMLISALINPAFNHEGVTVIAYLPSGNPLTLESVLYGIVAASMVATVICWFSCFNKIMTSDKFIYLFGRIIPSLSADIVYDIQICSEI